MYEEGKDYEIKKLHSAKITENENYVFDRIAIPIVKQGSEDGYWKKRCEAAEFLLSRFESGINKGFVGYKEWWQLKSQQPSKEVKQ